MLKLYSANSKFAASGLFQSRLSRQIAAWVFFGIVTIEVIILIPAYNRRKTEELQRLEAVSQEVLFSVKADMMSDMPERDLLGDVQLKENSIITGIALHDASGQLVDSLDDAPDFEAVTFIPKAKSWKLPLNPSPNPSATQIVRKLSKSGTRYDVAWPNSNPSAPYALAIRHDATAVKKTMRRYVLGITGLVIIISAFVTLVTLAVLQRIVIRPLLLLRDDLSMVGEAIAQGKTPTFASLQQVSPNELGEVAVAFQSMFNRIQQEIRDRHQAEADLRIEQAKADRLLLNVLPAEIATKLKENENNQGAIAERYESVTVLFADIVNFTGLAAETSPTELVCRLNDIFSAFDAIAERHGLEKIKTIGDAYMVVGGVPRPSDNHAEAVLKMAIEMLEFAEYYPMGNGRLCLRIGLNTGPVVAGVIGTQKFSYDLWGDAVNVASRMESQGVINRIQVSEETYLQLKDTYSFEDRGYLLIKGRGEMRAFLFQPPYSVA